MGETIERAVSLDTTNETKSVAGKYLTFALGQESYGIEILKVQEIMGVLSITKIPRVPRFIRGVINLRGKVIPVLDLRVKFDLEAQEDTERTCIIVVRIEQPDSSMTMGILVDEVAEVVDIEGDQIEEPPRIGSTVDTNFILGMGKIGEQVVILLDVDRVMSEKELVTTSGTSQAD